MLEVVRLMELLRELGFAVELSRAGVVAYRDSGGVRVVVECRDSCCFVKVPGCGIQLQASASSLREAVLAVEAMLKEIRASVRRVAEVLRRLGFSVVEGEVSVTAASRGNGYIVVGSDGRSMWMYIHIDMPIGSREKKAEAEKALELAREVLENI